MNASKPSTFLSIAAVPVLATAGFLAPAPLPSAPAAGGSGTIVDTAIAAGRFDTLVAALGAADLVSTLQAPGPFTVFAPTDRAFRNLPSGTVENLLLPENVDLLTSILLYHVVADELGSTEVVGSSYVETLNGQRAYIGNEGGAVTIGEAVIQFTDIQCTNGVIHVIDAVLLPETRNVMQVAAAAGDFRILVQLAKEADLFGALTAPGNLTVFAPTDDAFRSLGSGVLADLLLPQNQGLLQDILLFHATGERLYADEVVSLASIPMLNGGSAAVSVTQDGVFIDGVQILLTDIQASNGVIHVIDAVMTP